MTQDIYIDVYFGFNFLMDFVILLITGILINNKKKLARITFSSIIASVYSVIILITDAEGFEIMIFTYVVMAEIMLFTAFGKTDLKHGIKNIIILYFVTFLMNGAINAFYYGSGFKKSILQRAAGKTFGNVNVIFILCVVVISATIISGVIDMLKKHMKADINLHQVTITVNSKKVKLTALCDTGNSLTEPITKKPVSVVEMSVIDIFMKESLKHVVIPYNSVGKSHGIMNGFWADELYVDDKVINNAVIGIYEGKLSQSNDYQMLLHPNIMNNGEI